MHMEIRSSLQVLEQNFWNSRWWCRRVKPVIKKSICFVKSTPMEGTDSRHWEDLLPDALGLIFHNLSHQEKLTVIPRVCKPWSKAVMGPYCWQEIDIEEWSNGSGSGDVDRMLRLLTTRSYGCLRKQCVSGLQNEYKSWLDRWTWPFIAEHKTSHTRNVWFNEGKRLLGDFVF